jgi:hypothetical protein
LVTNGLVMCLDAGNRESYVSGSNIIYDLVPTRSISICGTVGENGTLTLTAPPNYVFTSVDFASYGTPTGSCGTFITSSCHSATSYTYVSSQLLGKTGSVSISATNANFGDPCSGTLKRLYVQATVTGPSITGSLINGPTFNSSNNGSIVFDGSNDYIQGPAIRMQNSFSVAGWIYHSSVGIGRMRYLTIDGEIGVIRKDNGVGVLHYYSTAPGGTTQITSANNFLVANKWYYVVGTWDGTIHRLYADGELLGSFAPYGYSGAITAISASYFVGGTGGGEIMNGRIAQTKIYNRALTADEIRQNYNATKGRFGL